jgi:hypothetical protein
MEASTKSAVARALAALGVWATLCGPALAQATGPSGSPSPSNTDPAMSSMPGREGSSTNAGPNPTVPGPGGSGNASSTPSTGGFGSGGSTLPDSRGAVRTPGNDINCPPGSSTAACGPTQTR